MLRLSTITAAFAVASITCAAALAMTHAPHHRQVGWMARDANPRHAWLYVSGYYSNNVLVYDLEQLGVPQIGAITTGVNGPRCVSLDASGSLYVSNTNGGNVTIYPPGATTPSLTLSGLTSPACATVDAQGNVWVSNHGTPSSIVVYPPGVATPSQTITDAALIKSPEQLAFDADGNAIFGDDVTGVSKIPVGSNKPVSLRLKGLVPNSTEGIAIDPRNGSLFVTFGFDTEHINVYRKGHRQPEHSISTPTADSFASGSFRHRNVLFVPGSRTNAVAVFHENATTAFASIQAGTSYTRGAAFKAAGVP